MGLEPAGEVAGIAKARTPADFRNRKIGKARAFQHGAGLFQPDGEQFADVSRLFLRQNLVQIARRYGHSSGNRGGIEIVFTKAFADRGQNAQIDGAGVAGLAARHPAQAERQRAADLL